MKKYILGLVAVLFLTVLIVPSFSLAQNTLPTDTDPNDTVSDCVSITNNLRYRDRDANKNGEVSTLQDFLQIKGYLNSEPTGYFGILTLKAVKDFQRDNNINPTGYVGTITRAKISSLTGCDGTTPPLQPLKVTFPSSNSQLQIGQTYKVTWTGYIGSSLLGDQVYKIYLSGNGVDRLYIGGVSVHATYFTWQIPQTITSGNYILHFELSGTTAISAYANSDLFTITSSTTPTDDLGCPPGQNYSSKSGKLCTDLGCYGEKYSRTSGQMCYSNTTSTSPVISSVSGPQTLNVGQEGTWTIKATDKSNGTLNYSVVWGDEVYATTRSSRSTASQSPQQSATFTHTYSTAGTYTPIFMVTNSSGQSAKTSLSVVVENLISTNHNPVLNPIAVPSGMSVGKSYDFTFNATDADNDNLSWDINWGDSGGGEACPITNSQQKLGWTYNTSHTWNTAGTYNVKVGVNDCKGGSAFSTFSVTVNNIITPVTTVFYPNGGETIKWSDPLLVSFTPTYGQRVYVNLVDINNAGYDLLSYNYINNLLGISADKQNVTLKLPVSWIATHGTQYKVEVCASNVCDKSDNYFNITFLLGDVNGDGSVTCVDVNMILDSVVGKLLLTTDQKNRADVDGNGYVQAYDASLLMQQFGLSCSTVGSLFGSSLTANALGALNEENLPTNNAPTFVESSCKFTMNLSKGMINEEVKCLQKMLGEKGFKVEGIESGKETTLFGYNTLMALKKFQTSNGLTADGIFGLATREALVK